MWKYKVSKWLNEDELLPLLEDYGANGWELSNVIWAGGFAYPYRIFFKRERSDNIIVSEMQRKESD